MTKTVLTIIDYGAGNVKSVTNALDVIGVKWKVTSNQQEVAKASKIIMPGVGSAGSAMKELRKRDLVGAIQNTRVPFLGICLGMQILFDWSDEGGVECLGILKGRVKRFNSKQVQVPQMGWNRVKNDELRIKKYELRIKNQKMLFKDIKTDAYFYFVHSYYCTPLDKNIITATTKYGIEFASALQWRNFYGVQFPPDKSGEIGLEMLRNFCEL